MTAHDHREYVPGCYRCELGRDEAESAMREELEEALSMVRCPYYQDVQQRRTPERQCDTGCYSEPACIANAPLEGWEQLIRDLAPGVSGTAGCRGAIGAAIMRAKFSEGATKGAVLSGESGSLTRQSYPYVARFVVDVPFEAVDNDAAFEWMAALVRTCEAQGMTVHKRSLLAGADTAEVSRNGADLADELGAPDE